MTNIVLLAVALFTTNRTGKCVCTTTGVWASDYCWSVALDYRAPAGVYQVEFTYTPEGPTPIPGGWAGMSWTRLNQSTNGSNLALSSYTNSAATNRISFPVPPWERAFFRLKRSN